MGTNISFVVVVGVVFSGDHGGKIPFRPDKFRPSFRHGEGSAHKLRWSRPLVFDSAVENMNFI